MTGAVATSSRMPHDKLIEINESNFDAAILAAPLPVLVDFTAVWCAPCPVIAPHVEALADKYAGRLQVGKCDVDDNPQLAAALGIRSAPTLLVFKAGQVVGQIVGSVPRARIEALVERALA